MDQRIPLCTALILAAISAQSGIVTDWFGTDRMSVATQVVDTIQAAHLNLTNDLMGQQNIYIQFGTETCAINASKGQGQNNSYAQIALAGEGGKFGAANAGTVWVGSTPALIAQGSYGDGVGLALLRFGELPVCAIGMPWDAGGMFAVTDRDLTGDNLVVMCGGTFSLLTVGPAILGGDVTFGTNANQRCDFVGGSGATPPSDTNHPSGWIDIEVNGVSKKLPFYE